MKRPLRFRVKTAHWPADAAPIQRIRRRVFVVEQGVPEELEWDGQDGHALHLLAETPNGEPIATARLLPEGRLGRMAVLPAYRSRGVGSALLRQALSLAREQGLKRLSLHAQAPVVGFYERFGFTCVGEEFEEAGIRHRAMQRAVQ